MYKKKFLALLAFTGIVLTSCGDEEQYIGDSKKTDAPYIITDDFGGKAKHTLADGITGTDWLSHIEDSRKVCKLSIPGTHDALTGMGFYDQNLQYIFNLTAISQVADLKQQLNCGIRFFDIRPVVSTDTVQHKRILRCTHGMSELKVTFGEALDGITSFLAQHPSEFVIVKMQHDNGSENQAECYTMLRDFLAEYDSRHKGIFAEWRPDLTVGELRGKVLFINRFYFEGQYGACCKWPDEDPDIDENVYIDEECNREVTDAKGTVKSTMCVQDYYKTTSEKRLETKRQAVLNMMAVARKHTADASDNTWIVNHCSAYTEVSPRGYVTNAVTIHKAAIENLLSNPGKTVGIMPMDFSCYDTVSCIINGGSPYLSDYIYNFEPMSLSLTNLLIMSNFK